MKNFNLVLDEVKDRISYSRGKNFIFTYPFFRVYDDDNILTKIVIDEISSIEGVDFVSVSVDSYNKVYALFSVDVED